ncbi:glucose-6-phosphate isomerase 1, chloroplastic [Tanacetum coccineum]
MIFLLTAFKVYYVLEGPPIGLMTEEEERKREQDEILCRGYILSTLTDRLYDLYTPMTFAREIWNYLEEKYTTEKEWADKFITFKFFEFAMEDNVSILDHVHEFLISVSKFNNLNIEIPEKLLVGVIITKLPSSWHNYRKKLMHTLEDFTLDQIQKHLQIEEETHIREKNPNGASTFKVSYVDSGKNNKGNDKKRKGTWNSSKNNKKDKKPLSEVVCYKCGEKGHIKRYYKNPKKKNQNSNKKDESANAVEQVDTTEIAAMVFEMNIGMIQELHMASVTITDDWWYDSGAITHLKKSGDPIHIWKDSLWTKVIVAIHGVGGKIHSEWTSAEKSCWLSILSEVRSLQRKDRRTSLVNSFRRIPKGGIEQNQFDSLVELVRSVTIVPLADRWNWNLESTGIFLVASAHRRIDEICLPNIGEETRWVKCVPIKINVLAWKIKTDALPTRFNISRRGFELVEFGSRKLELICRMEVLACFNSYGFQTQKDVRRSLVLHLVVRLDLSKQAPI